MSRKTNGKYVQTDADERYGELLQRLRDEGGADWGVIRELDETVGVRLSESERRVLGKSTRKRLARLEAKVTDLYHLTGTDEDSFELDAFYAASQAAQASAATNPDRDATRTPTECECSPPVRADHHAWLLGFESRPNGYMEIIDHCMISDDGEAEPGTLGWIDFPNFAARHNWQSPESVVRFAEFIDRSIREGRERVRLRDHHRTMREIHDAFEEQEKRRR